MKIKRGFTLIELLVVISIIALLLAILMPALGVVKERAKFTICKSNLRSYGFLAIMYTSDNDSWMPNPWTNFYSQWEFPGEPHRYCRWHNSDYNLEKYPEFAGPFWSYLEVKDIHLCPTFISIAKKYGTEHPHHVETVAIEPNYNYSMNTFLGEKKMSNIKRLSDIFFFGEENIWLNQEYNSVYAFNDTAFAHDMGDWFGTFHNIKGGDRESGTVNAVFLDGHVQNVDREDTGKFSGYRN